MPDPVINVSLTNCCNIKKATAISFKPGCINVKLGLNGTGKSTLAKSLKSSKEELSELCSFEYFAAGKPKSLFPGIDSPFNAVKVFDEEYVASNLYQATGLVKDGFEIVLHTKKMATVENGIKTLLENLQQKVNSPSIQEIIGYLSDLPVIIKSKKGDVLPANCKAAKGLKNGNRLEQAKETFSEYSLYFEEDIDQQIEWAHWHSVGSKWQEMGTICPYCACEESAAVRKRIGDLDALIGDESIKNLNDVFGAFGKAARCLSPSISKELDNIRRSKTELSQDQEQSLVAHAGKAKLLIEKVNRLKYLSESPRAFAEFSSDAIKELAGKFITKDDISFLDDEAKAAFSPLLKAEDEISKSLDELDVLVEEQRSELKATIGLKEKELNDFLRQVNYPYTVEISSTGNASLLLKPLEENCEPIKEPSKTLSYGERNAMSLILFAYMALYGSEEPDLIVLDDPISSFDADKRYSILYTLFQKPEKSILSRTFHDKTILILTHDYPLVADLVLDEKRFGKLHACFLHCDREGNLKEQKIEPRRTMTSNAGLQSFSFMQNKKIGACEKHPLIRLSYLRRLLEFEGYSREVTSKESGFDEYIAWNILSSLLHKRDCPEYHGQPIDGFPSGEPNSDYGRGKIIIESRLGNGFAFSYCDLLERARDWQTLAQLYFELENDLEKMQVCRIVIQDTPYYGENTMTRYLDESCHVSGDYLFQLDPDTFRIVPHTATQYFDRIMKSFLEKRG